MTGVLVDVYQVHQRQHVGIAHTALALFTVSDPVGGHAEQLGDGYLAAKLSA